MILVGTEVVGFVFAIAGDEVVVAVVVAVEVEVDVVVVMKGDLIAFKNEASPASLEEDKLSLVTEVEDDDTVLVLVFGVTTLAEGKKLEGGATFFLAIIGESSSLVVVVVVVETGGVVRIEFATIGFTNLGVEDTGRETGSGFDKTGNLLRSIANLLLVNVLILLETLLGIFLISAMISSVFITAALVSLFGIACISSTISLSFCCVSDFFFSVRAIRLD